MGLNLCTYKKSKSVSPKTGYLYRVFLHLQQSQNELAQAIEIMQENEPWYDTNKNTSKKPEKTGK